MELAVGNYLTLTARTGEIRYRFQNFHIAETASFEDFDYGFLPFGFSGVTINKDGSNTEASLLFPNNALSRGWGVQAVQERWTATVLVMLLNPDDRTQGSRMHQYTGQVATGSWDDISLNLTLNTIVDAVGADVPLRRLTQALVGNLPITANVRLR